VHGSEDADRRRRPVRNHAAQVPSMRLMKLQFNESNATSTSFAVQVGSTPDLSQKALITLHKAASNGKDGNEPNMLTGQIGMQALTYSVPNIE